MSPRDQMTEDLRILVGGWAARGESPIDGVWVLAFAASIGVDTAPVALRQEALDAVRDGLLEGAK